MMKEYNNVQEQIMTKNKRFLLWLYSKLQKGYFSYLNLVGIENLINKVVEFYETNFIGSDDKQNLFEELKQDLSPRELKTFDFGYRAKGGYCVPIGGYYNCNGVLEGVKRWEHYIGFKIYNKEHTKSVTISATANEGRIKDKMLELGLEANTTLSDLYNVLSNNEDIDCSELQRILSIYENDFELRNKIFKNIALLLRNSINFTPEISEKIAIKFINDIKECYGINITELFEQMPTNRKGVSSNINKYVLIKKIKKLESKK